MSFGKNVKCARMERKLSLHELSRLASVSVPMLSKIERGEKTPTIRIASQIAKALKLRIGQLMDESISSTIAIVKKSERKLLLDPLSQIKSFEVTPSTDPNLGIILVVLPEGASTGIILAARSGSREYIIVNKGSITVDIDESKYTLDEGDCILFEADMQHQITNVGPEEAKYYVISDRHSHLFS